MPNIPMISEILSNALTQEKLNMFVSLRSVLQRVVQSYKYNLTCSSSCLPEQSISNPAVIPFGSITCATAFDDGDVDFALLFNRHTEHDNNANQNVNTLVDFTRSEQENVLLSLNKYIKNNWPDAASIVHDECIFKARTPIISYTLATNEHNNSETKNLKFDISLSLNGVRNSLLLRRYMESDQRLRQGTMYLKQWGRRKRILNARRGFISPYALTIMYIYYMQLAGKTNREHDEQIVKQDVDDKLCAIMKNNELLNDDRLFKYIVPFESVDCAIIEDDLKSFFSFFSANDNFDFDTAVIDIRKHDTIREKDNWLQMLGSIDAKERWNLLGHEVLMLRDPFEEHNLGRSVDFFNAENIREQFRLAAKDIKFEQLL